MTTQASTQPRRRLTVPILAVAVAIALVAGLMIGVQSLRSATNAGAGPGPTVPPQYIDRGDDNGGNPVSIPLRASGVTSQPCSALDARAYVPYCGFSDRTRNAATSRTTWQACHAMDPTAYRELCNQGDGGRWIEGAQPPGQ